MTKRARRWVTVMFPALLGLFAVAGPPAATAAPGAFAAAPPIVHHAASSNAVTAAPAVTASGPAAVNAGVIPVRMAPEPGRPLDEPEPDPEPTTTVAEPTSTTGPAPSTTATPTTTATSPPTTRHGSTPATDPDGHRSTTTVHAPTSTVPRPTTTEVAEADRQPTTTTRVRRSAGRPSASPRVRDSHIPVGSIVLALVVLAIVGLVARQLVLRRPGADEEDEASSGTAVATATPPPEPTGAAESITSVHLDIDPATADFLIGLGEALMDAGTAVGHVESALQTVARVAGATHIGVVVLPTALIVSVPDGEDLVTELGAPGRAPLRFDQSEDVLRLLREAEAGTVTPTEGARRLTEIRSAPEPYPAWLGVLGSTCTAAGVAAILLGGWVEIPLAAVLGAAVGAFRRVTRRLDASYQPFVVLVAATILSATVFALTRAVGDLSTFPVLISPLISFLPGGLLTIAVLELATGQIVSGASRLASGGLQLVLLSIGLVAGAQLVGVPTPELSSTTQGAMGPYVPWIGIAVYGLGVVWFQGARASARIWILLVMYVAYAGQVIGGLFFGGSLSAFFGALAMTPVAVLLARRSTAPSPLVLILPGFWLLVPGSLGLAGVTGLFGAGGADTTGVLVTTVTSMVGVSLGILLGLLLVARDPARPFSETRVVEVLGTVETPEPDPDEESESEPDGDG